MSRHPGLRVQSLYHWTLYRAHMGCVPFNNSSTTFYTLDPGPNCVWSLQVRSGSFPRIEGAWFPCSILHHRLKLVRDAHTLLGNADVTLVEQCWDGNGTAVISSKYTKWKPDFLSLWGSIPEWTKTRRVIPKVCEGLKRNKSHCHFVYSRKGTK